ncbi:MAG: hypothetical protein K2X86_09115 [Cytophagaceae bacterium]|nr:hypothetical protein [Cytophagaceae bacterium]
MKLFRHSYILLSFLLFGCPPKKEEPRLTTYLDQEFKDYMFYPDGSYWVYEHESMGWEDSVYLYSQLLAIEEPHNLSNNYERIVLRYGSTFNLDTFHIIGHARDLPIGRPCYSNILFTSNFLAVNIPFFSKRDIGYVFEYNENINSTYTAYYDSLEILSKYYYKVKVFEMTGSSDSRLPKKIFHAEKTGIIRKELFNGQIWNLKRHFINQA